MFLNREDEMRAKWMVFILAVICLCPVSCSKSSTTGPETAAPKKMAYVDQAQSYAIVVANLDGTGKETIPGITAAYGLSNIFNNKVAYTKMGAPKMDLWVVNVDGTGNTQITYGLDVFQPTASSNGTIVYRTSLGTNTDIYAIMSDGTGNTQLTYTNVTNEICPAISWDGSTVVFISGASDIGYISLNAGLTSYIITPVYTGALNCVTVDATGDNIYFSVSNAGPSFIYKCGFTYGGASTQVISRAEGIGNLKFFEGSSSIFYDWNDTVKYNEISSVKTDGTGDTPIVTGMQYQSLDRQFWD
jgi:hypothetical protein